MIDPEFAYTFLGLSPDRIAAIVDGVLRVGDAVEQKAHSEVADLTPTETALLLTAAYMKLTQQNDLSFDGFRDNSFLRGVYDRVPGFPRDYYFYVDGALEDEFDDDDDESYWEQHFTPPPDPTHGYSNERLVADLEQMPFYQGAAHWEFDSTEAWPLQALLLDAAVRYNLNEHALLEHVFERLRVAGRFSFEDLDDELTSE